MVFVLFAQIVYRGKKININKKKKKMQITTLFELDKKSYWHMDKLLCTVHLNIVFE